MYGVQIYGLLNPCHTLTMTTFFECLLYTGVTLSVLNESFNSVLTQFHKEGAIIISTL
jgi:hypothetical protein